MSITTVKRGLSQTAWISLVLLAAGAAAGIGLMPGCSGGDTDQGKDLDTTFVRVEQYLDAGRALDARRLLLASLNRSPGGWKGVQAGPAYQLLGDLSRQRGLLDSAMVFYLQAEQAYRSRVQRPEAFAMSLAVVGIHRIMERNGEALALGSEVLRLATLFGDSAAVQNIRWVLLDIYDALQEPAEMDHLAPAVRSFCQRAGDTGGEARLAYLLGTADAERGAYDAAIGRLLESVTLAGRARDSSLLVRGFLALAAAFERTGKAREAQESFATALQQSSSPTTDPALALEALVRAGNVALRNHRTGDATGYLQRAYEDARHNMNTLGEAYVLMQLGHCCSPGARKDADTLFRQAYSLFKKIGHARGSAYALVSLGRLAEADSRVTDAFQLYGSGVKEQEASYAHRGADDLWRDCEVSTLGGAGVDAHAVLVSLLLQTGRADDAFWYQERRTARWLADDLCSWKVTTGSAATDSLVRSTLHLRALHIGVERVLEEMATSPRGSTPLLTAIRTELWRLEEKLAAGAERALRADARLAPLLRADGMRCADVQKVLPPDVTLLVYMPTPRALYVNAVTATQTSLHIAAVPRERLIELATRYGQECAQRSAVADSLHDALPGQDMQMRDLTRNLYEALILPVEPVLRSGNRLLVLLPPELPVFSLAGLRRGGSPGAPAVAERFEVSYLPTAAYAGVQSVTPVPVHAVTALGVRGSTTWDVEYELRDIHAFYRDAQLFFDKDATLSRLCATKADLLHLSLEMRFTQGRPLNGVFVLGDGAEPDGITTVPLGALYTFPPVPTIVLFNLSAQQPSTDRAVAAACLSNGTASVVLSTTPLTRKAKKMFDEGFYTALLAGETVPAALQSAQNAIARSEELSAPPFWAPLMLWGKGGAEERRTR